MERNGIHKGLVLPKNPGSRFYIGLILFILSFLMLPTGLFLQGFSHIQHVRNLIITVFWLAAPVLKITSVAIMGKPTYLWIKTKTRHVFRRVFKPYHGSQLRYDIGLVMFCLPVFPNFIMAYAPQLVTDNFYLRIIINIVIDVLFIISLFVLGGDFWDKLKALFIFSAKATFPRKRQTKKR
ncbi:MAG: hypothetical protein Q8867_05215 [Bacteroidota bacterium]|nr:hypothetical protein [Bacteroidota bacterium]